MAIEPNRTAQPQRAAPPEQENMILRTVYFPPELDEELKQLAFSRSTSKGELIRRAVRDLVATAGDEEPPVDPVGQDGPEVEE